jgi:cell division protein FtsW (lipid II flippase)
MSEDRNHISVGQWMLLLFLTAIPCVGLILVLVLAFVGENESRKNYFRAIILWFIIAVAVVALIVTLGDKWPELQKKIQEQMQRH